MKIQYFDREKDSLQTIDLPQGVDCVDVFIPSGGVLPTVRIMSKDDVVDQIDYADIEDLDDVPSLPDIPLKRWQESLEKREPQAVGSLTCDGITAEDIFGIGQKVWFEYRCWEDHDSQDAELWYRSHQEVVVLGFADCDPPVYATAEARAYFGHPIVYKVQFTDGFVAHATEDELMLSTDDFCRPDPPARPD